MSRWEPDARQRLERAALELFTEQGFADTTVPQITARAGLTTRTFFRHFSDKREALFAGEDELPARVSRLIAEAPAALRPMAVIEDGLVSFAAAQWEGQLEHLRRRSAVIQGDGGLREREMRKQSAMADAMFRGFRDRGVDELTALVTARVATTVVSVSMGRWLAQDGDAPLAEFMTETLRALRAVAAEPAGRTNRA